MNIADLEYFRNVLTERESSLTELLDSLADSSAEMAAKIRLLLQEIREALGRIEDRTFGRCKVCCGEVERHRLMIQPASTVCLDCISDDEKVQLEEELSVASRIHRALLPQEIPNIDGFEIAVRAEASRMVGGDYYDFLKSSNGDWTRIVIADSMGKGIPAGLLMSNLQGALRVLSEMTENPELMMASLNRWICRNIPMTKFISLICVELRSTPGSGAKVCCTNAGHPPPILIRDNGEIERPETAGIVLGVEDSSDYTSIEIQVDPGDLLILYTDGITEAANRQGEMYDENRLLRFLQSGRTHDLSALLDDLISDIRDFVGHSELEDDFTVVALRRRRAKDFREGA